MTDEFQLLGTSWANRVRPIGRTSFVTADSTCGPPLPSDRPELLPMVGGLVHVEGVSGCIRVSAVLVPERLSSF
jgi:hypothetical protein